MTTWIKESGDEIEINDEEATIKEALNLGWELEEGMEVTDSDIDEDENEE